MVRELKKKFIRTTMLVVTLLLAVFLAAVNILNYSLAGNDSRSALDQIVDQHLRSLPGGMAGSGLGKDGLTKRGQNPGRYFIARVNESGAVDFRDLTHDPDISFDEMIELINAAGVKFAPEATGETETEPRLPQGGDAPSRGEGEKAGDVPPPGAGEKAEDTTTPDTGEKAEETLSPGTGEKAGDVPPPEERGKEAPGFEEESGSVNGYLYYALKHMDGSVAYAFLDVSQETESMIRILLITAALGLALWLLILLLVVFLSERAIAPIARNIEKQRRFITDAGHEIKTPLAVILSNVDVLELHEGKTKWTGNIRDQALRLSELTKQMLVLAKMEESGTAAITSTTFDASQVLEDTISIFHESASLRGIELRRNITPGVMICFSKEQYQQMLELLLDNAVKYGKENGFLSVSLRTGRKMIHLSFQNDCEELPDVDPDQLFDRFYRSDASRSRQTGGSGIGLSIVRAIAEQGGGSAKAHFLEGNVIEFVVELPRSRA